MFLLQKHNKLHVNQANSITTTNREATANLCRYCEEYEIRIDVVSPLILLKLILKYLPV